MDDRGQPIFVHPQEGFLEPVEWHARLPGVIVSAAALIGDGAGGVLVVKPNYRDHWTLPGGICEFGESPRAGCAREVAEELGVDRQPGALLAIDWQQAQEIYGPTARPAVFFIFDGGILPSLTGIRLQAAELDDCRFAPASDLEFLLPSRSLPRVNAALAALSSGIVRTGPGLAAL
jgi:ADP-ribose pyrophosphatase YjhB (NUDIX family)